MLGLDFERALELLARLRLVLLGALEHSARVVIVGAAACGLARMLEVLFDLVMARSLPEQGDRLASVGFGQGEPANAVVALCQRGLGHVDRAIVIFARV